jgi:hypothetical protein
MTEIEKLKAARDAAVAAWYAALDAYNAALDAANDAYLAGLAAQEQETDQ